MSVRAAWTISALVRAMPGFSATAEEWAAWLELKARVLERVASRHRALAADAERCARAARDQAGKLWAARS